MDVQDPHFTIAEFLDFLFSKQNDLWDPTKDTVYQDMSRPLAHYWIASSHNTYDSPRVRRTDCHCRNFFKDI
jgi:phosphatidylinositol phospholipase C gamma-1